MRETREQVRRRVATFRQNRVKVKAASLHHAVTALCERNMHRVRSLIAVCDHAAHWHISANCAGGNNLPPVVAPDYSLHYIANTAQKFSLERQRIARLLAFLARRGVRVRQVVTGTKTGPDLVLKLADGSLAIVEVKGNCGVHGMLNTLAERYSYLLDNFSLYYASEALSGRWRLWRVRKRRYAAVEPEALNG